MSPQESLLTPDEKGRGREQAGEARSGEYYATVSESESLNALSLLFPLVEVDRKFGAVCVDEREQRGELIITTNRNLAYRTEPETTRNVAASSVDIVSKVHGTGRNAVSP